MGNPLAIAKLKARRARTLEQIKHERRTKAKKRAVAPKAAPLVVVGRHEVSGEGVYVLREQGTNMVKIGCTGDFRIRYASLSRSDNPRRLIFLGWLSRDMSDEGEFHAEFSAYRSRLGGGIEWFELPEEQIEALQGRLTR